MGTDILTDFDTHLDDSVVEEYINFNFAPRFSKNINDEIEIISFDLVLY